MFLDYYLIRLAVSDVSRVSEFKSGDESLWKGMSNAKQIEALQRAERELSISQKRPMEKVYGYSGKVGEYGFYAPPSDPVYPRGIYINIHESVLGNRAEALNTLVHEGRHAYQEYSISRSESHPNAEAVDGWKKNMQDIKEKGWSYVFQPIERDAGAFAYAVTKATFPDYVPSCDAADRYNSTIGEVLYGPLVAHLTRQQHHSSINEVSDIAGNQNPKTSTQLSKDRLARVSESLSSIIEKRDKRREESNQIQSRREDQSRHLNHQSESKNKSHGH